MKLNEGWAILFFVLGVILWISYRAMVSSTRVDGFMGSLLLHIMQKCRTRDIRLNYFQIRAMDFMIDDHIIGRSGLEVQYALNVP